MRTKSAASSEYELHHMAGAKRQDALAAKNQHDLVDSDGLAKRRRCAQKASRTPADAFDHDIVTIMLQKLDHRTIRRPSTARGLRHGVDEQEHS
jgi:hypothetical protein